MGKAHIFDLYDKLSLVEWKTGRELIEELNKEGYKTAHLGGTMYVYLSMWEDENYIKSQKREITEEEFQLWEDLGYRRENKLPQREYLRKSTGKPRKLLEQLTEEIGDLEKNLVPES